MIIGTCSRCGGTVTVPDVWGGVIPPTPTCSACGATAAGHGPIIQIKLVKAEENEACAKVCDNAYMARTAADAIRARRNHG